MKKYLIIVLLLLSFAITGCKKDDNTTDTNEPKASDKYSYVYDVVNEEGVSGYKGWTKPGLYDIDGNEFVSHTPNETTEPITNVLDYGAVANDPSFDNTLAVKQAIADTVEGGEIYFPNGTYYFSSQAYASSYYAHIALKSGVNLRGESAEGVTLVSNFSERTNESQQTTVILVGNGPNVTISDVTISSVALDSDLPDPNISNVSMFANEAPKYGITVANTNPLKIMEKVTIDNVIVEKYQRMGVRIDRARDVVVQNSTFRKTMDLGAGGYGYGVNIQGLSHTIDGSNSNIDCLHNVVKDCVFEGPYLRHGVIIQYYAHNNLITNNTFNGTLLDSIDLHGEFEYLNEITNNTINDTRSGAGVGVGNTGSTHDASGAGNYIHDNVIDGCDRGIDIILGSPYTFVIDNVIKNTIADDSTGILVHDGPNTMIVGNTIQNISGSETVGIEILYAYNPEHPEVGIPSDYVIDGNTIDTVTTGMYIECYQDFTILDNVYNDNGTDVVNLNNEFELPEASELFTFRPGVVSVAIQDTYVETGSPTTNYGLSKQLKFKASIYDPGYNRVIYYQFDNSSYNPEAHGDVYLRLTAKSKDGLVIASIYGTTKYNGWSETALNWDNSKYHDDSIAVVDNSSGDLTKIVDFQFLRADNTYYTYYINVTDYIKSLESDLFTVVITNDNVDDMYSEFRSREQAVSEEQPALIYTYPE